MSAALFWSHIQSSTIGGTAKKNNSTPANPYTVWQDTIMLLIFTTIAGSDCCRQNQPVLQVRNSFSCDFCSLFQMHVLQDTSFMLVYVHSSGSLNLCVQNFLVLAASWFSWECKKPSWMDVISLTCDQLVGPCCPAGPKRLRNLPMASPHVLHVAAYEGVAPCNVHCKIGAGSGTDFFCPGFWLESNQVSDKQSNIKHMEMERNNTEAISTMNSLSRHSLKIHQTMLGSDCPFLSKQECYLLGSSFGDQFNYWTNFEVKEKLH